MGNVAISAGPYRLVGWTLIMAKTVFLLFGFLVCLLSVLITKGYVYFSGLFRNFPSDILH